MATQPQVTTSRVPRMGPPANASQQRDKVLRLLKEAGPRGVSREHFLFHLRITQVTARLNELEKMGYKFSSKWAKPNDEYVTYYLESEPVVVMPLQPKGKATATHELCPHCGQVMPPERRRPTRVSVAESTTVQPPSFTSSTVEQGASTLFELGTPAQNKWRDPEQAGLK